MISVSLWTPYIWKFEYEFDHDLMASAVEEVSSHWSVTNDSSVVEIGDSYSTARVGVYDADLQPHKLKYLEPFNAWLEPVINNIWSECKFFQINSEVSKSWFNVHKKTGQTIEHTHNKTDLVVSAYVRCEEGSGNIEFRDPLEYHKINSAWHESQLWKELKVKTNDVLVFHGWLNHRTQPNMTDTERIVMTYNINGNPFI
jgi:hypothetical protein